MSVGPVVGDAIATGLFVFISSIWEELGGILAETGIPSFAAGLAVLITGLALFDPVAQLVGGHGVSFNPATSACFAAAGKGSWRSHAQRMIGQTVGATIGAVAAFRLVPSSWQGTFYGQGGKLGSGATLVGGLGCEFALALMLHLSILWSMGMKSKVAGFSTPLAATVPLVYMGTGLTGPSMNPAVTAGWVACHRGQSWPEHLLVYWLGPLLGGAAAGWAWHWATAPAKKRRPSKPRASKGKPAIQSPGKQPALAKKAD